LYLYRLHGKRAIGQKVKTAKEEKGKKGKRAKVQKGQKGQKGYYWECPE
jgi:hypothetical protein